MKRLSGITLIACLAVLLGSCIKKDFDLPPCDSHLRIIPEWVNTQQRGTHVDVSIIADSGAEKDTVSTEAGIDVDLPARRYNIVGYEEADNTSVDGRIVSVASGSDGMLLDPQPFAGGAVVANVQGYAEQNNRIQVIPLPIRQQTRELIIQVVFLNDGFSSVTGISGVLNRAALSRDINDAFPPASGAQYINATSYGSLAYTFTLETEDGEDFYEGSRQLLGIDHSGLQIFDLTVYLDNTEETLNIDLSRAFDGFHTKDVDKPWLIVLEVDLSAQLEMTIITWKVVEVPDMVAE